MARKRPAVLTVMGILNIVIGSLFLLCNLCAGIVLLVFLGPTAPGGAFPGGVNPIVDMWSFMKTEVPAFAVISVGEIVANVVLNVVLIIAGIGLLNVKSWGRILSICYSVFTLLVKIGSLIFTLAIVNAATARWQVDFARRHPGMMAGDGMNNAAMNSIGTVFGVIVGVTYAVVLLIMMLLPSVSAALAGRPRHDDYDLDPHDEDEDLGRDRRGREEWNE